MRKLSSIIFSLSTVVKMFADYRRSLKMPEAEELLDILLFRPAGYIFVRLIYRTPVTPNQVTLLSMIAGLIAGYDFSFGIAPAYVGAAVWYAVANVLDCADGQLARLQQSGTSLGRIVDGVADYISSTAIFLGIGMGYAHGGVLSWILVIAAGISSAVHAIVFDHYQSEFIAAGIHSLQFKEHEIDRFQKELNALRGRHKEFLRIAVLRLYLRYLRMQTRGAGRNNSNLNPGIYRSTHRNMIRLFSFLGPTTNRTLLILCALANNVGLFLWIVVIPLNLWLIITLMIHRGVNRRFVALSAGEEA
jgi:hypothetical protein